jgi:uncharacterized protein
VTNITPLISADSQVIQSYKSGGFKISSRIYDGAVVVFPDRVIPFPVTDVAALTPENFEQFTVADGLDVILLGCGARGVMPPPAIKALLKSRRISLDTMDTGAACRTYNVLLAEGRRVAAVLLPL